MNDDVIKILKDNLGDYRATLGVNREYLKHDDVRPLKRQELEIAIAYNGEMVRQLESSIRILEEM